MKLNTVIFDMDGLLIDSEPLWNQAAAELFLNYGKQLNAQQYNITTGLRTKEFLEHWFSHFKLPADELFVAEKKIIAGVINLVKHYGRPMPGVSRIINFFLERKFNIGLASSSPPELINEVIDLLEIRAAIKVISSAGDLAFGKPHPEVYLNCAGRLGVIPAQCVCFEDSFNGMIAVKAAKMKCVVVPSLYDIENPVWEAADLKISTLNNFNELLLNRL